MGHADAVSAVRELEPIPALVVTLTDDVILARAEQLARRGKLPGFERAGEGWLFRTAAFGAPFDYTLLARTASEGPGRVMRFELRLRLRAPLIAFVVTVLTIWPGVWLTDSMLRTYFSGYDYRTWMWYLPLSVLPLPWYFPRALRKSREAAVDHAMELVERLRVAFGEAGAADRAKTGTGGVGTGTPSGETAFAGAPGL